MKAEILPDKAPLMLFAWKAATSSFPHPKNGHTAFGLVWFGLVWVWFGLVWFGLVRFVPILTTWGVGRIYRT
ncbi:hypothetical protein NL529_34765, partial [Klebsiella pneumoniae]|nr:hypothetical protein [Klebsiella pneumoniae]